MDSYYTGEQRTTAGFMRMARQGLRMIDVLAGDLGETIRGAFLKTPLLELSAHAVVAIINTLVRGTAAAVAVGHLQLKQQGSPQLARLSVLHRTDHL